MSTYETEPAPPPPVAVLEFSDDLRYQDVVPLRAFLEDRLAEAVAAQQEGSATHFAAVRLREITVSDCVYLADMLSEWELVVLAGRQGQVGNVQTLRQNLSQWWNRLAATARGFTDHPEYRPRWRVLNYTCEAHAELVEEAAGDGPVRSR